MGAIAVEVNEQSGVSGFVLPDHRVDIVRLRGQREVPAQLGETILQDVLVLLRPAGVVFTRPRRRRSRTRTVTVAVTPEQVDILVAARAKGISVPVAPRGQRPSRSGRLLRTPKPEESEESGRQDEDGERARGAEASRWRRSRPSALLRPRSRRNPGPRSRCAMLHPPAAPRKGDGSR